MKLDRKALCVLCLVVAVAAVVVLVLTLENRRHAKKIHRSIIPGVPTPFVPAHMNPKIAPNLGPGGENPNVPAHMNPKIAPNLGPGGENPNHSIPGVPTPMHLKPRHRNN
tara:strand:+ start:315 stop:644 length:330 start_codon:yes stop_codon:yes gene_type:complete